MFHLKGTGIYPIILKDVQWSLTYLDCSLIRTHFWEPIMIIYIGSVSLIRILSYPDSQLRYGGVRISEAPLLYYEILFLIDDRPSAVYCCSNECPVAIHK